MTAAMFFATSMSLTYLSANQTKDTSIMSIMDQLEETEAADLEKKSGVESDAGVSDARGNSKVDRIPE